MNVFTSLRTGLLVLVVVAFAASSWSQVDPEQLGSTSSLDQLKMGFGAVEEGRYEDALDHYRLAFELTTISELRFQSHLGMGLASVALGRLSDARSSYELALEIRPGHAHTLFFLGQVAKDQGRYEDAATLFANAAVQDPAIIEALIELGVVYAHLGRNRDAADACGRAVAAQSDHEAALLCHGVALYHLGLYPEAAEAFTTVTEINPDNPRAHYGLGLAKLFGGDRDGAITEYGLLRALDPDLAGDLYDRIFSQE